ncbi:MAG: 50S ribosomal protein L24 [Rickettsiales bacterium]|jgi:large subunit ribosomal protein L24|nr:50S ribosomal protein L24 [Rickettsiales bacterium]
MKIKKGDTVKIITGKDKGKTGEALGVFPKTSRILVRGVNLAKIHKKPTSSSPGQIISVEKEIHISNVSLIENGKPAKVGFKVEDGKKIRYFKKSGNKAGK